MNLGRFFTSSSNLKQFNAFKVKMGFMNHKLIKPHSISYMQKEERMAKIVNFDYAMIIFISLFVVAMNIDRKPFFYHSQVFLVIFYMIFYLILLTSFIPFLS